MHRVLKRLALAGLLAISFAAHSAVIRSIDLTPVDGTAFSDITTAGGVRFNFGYGYGLGSVRFTAVSAGTTFPLLVSNSVSPPSITLDNGNQFAPNSLFVFNARDPNATSFFISVTLDSGVFATGSLFEILSLDRSGNQAQYFLPGAGFGAVDSHQLASDGAVPLVDVGGLFSAQSNGVSAGRAWQIGGVNSIQGTFSQDREFGGVGFRIGVPEVPEPASVMLVLAALGALAATRKRSRSAASSDEA